MSIDYPGVYLPTELTNVYESTPLANAGWYEEGQHGGVFAALVAGHIELVPTLSEMQTSRITVELFRVIPLVPLRIEHEVVREGKRIQTVVANVFDPKDTLLAMATIQRLRIDDLPVPEDARPPEHPMPLPDPTVEPYGNEWGVGDHSKVMYHRQGVEVQAAIGGFEVKGPGSVWIRTKTPIVAGLENTPLQRFVAAADFINGVSRAVDIDKWLFMNPDLTIHVTRYPSGEWIGLSAESTYGDVGRGLATGSIWDESGFIGRSTQTLFLDHVS